MEKKKVGRPKTPEYRKVKHRFSKVEDTFTSILDELSSEKDKQLVMKALEQIRA